MLEDGTQCSAELGLYVTEVVGRSGGLPPLYIEHSWNIRILEVGRGNILRESIRSNIP